MNNKTYTENEINSDIYKRNLNDAEYIPVLHEITNDEKKLLNSIYKDMGNKDTIFIAMASYRDDECKNTIIGLSFIFLFFLFFFGSMSCNQRESKLTKKKKINKDAFETAKYPERLRFGVFQQHNFTDGDCADFDKIISCPGHPLCNRYWQVLTFFFAHFRILCFEKTPFFAFSQIKFY